MIRDHAREAGEQTEPREPTYTSTTNIRNTTINQTDPAVVQQMTQTMISSVAAGVSSTTSKINQVTQELEHVKKVCETNITAGAQNTQMQVSTIHQDLHHMKNDYEKKYCY